MRIDITLEDVRAWGQGSYRAPQAYFVDSDRFYLDELVQCSPSEDVWWLFTCAYGANKFSRTDAVAAYTQLVTQGFNVDKVLSEAVAWMCRLDLCDLVKLVFVSSDSVVVRRRICSCVAANGHLTLISQLIADVSDLRNYGGYALNQAVKAGQTSVVQYLYGLGADTDAPFVWEEECTYAPKPHPLLQGSCAWAVSALTAGQSVCRTVWRCSGSNVVCLSVRVEGYGYESAVKGVMCTTTDDTAYGIPYTFTEDDMHATDWVLYHDKD